MANTLQLHADTENLSMKLTTRRQKHIHIHLRTSSFHLETLCKLRKHAKLENAAISQNCTPNFYQIENFSEGYVPERPE